MPHHRPGNIGINRVINQLMIKAGYQVQPSGVCYGLTLMNVQALLAGEIERDRFFNRLQYIQEHEHTLSQQLSDWSQSYKKNEKIVDGLLDILAFFDSIALYQDPHISRKMNKKNENYNDHDFMDQKKNAKEVSSLLISSALTERKGLKRVKLKRMIFENEKKLFNYSRDLTEKIEKIGNKLKIKNNLPIAIVLGAAQHAINISYLPDKKLWLLFDSNQAPYRIVAPEQLHAELIQAIAARRDILPEKFYSSLEIYTTGEFFKHHRNIFKPLYHIKRKYRRGNLLHHTVRNKDKRALQALLLRHPKKLSSWVIQRDRERKTPIQTAISHGNIDHAITLLKILNDFKRKKMNQRLINRATQGMLKTLVSSQLSKVKVVKFIRFLNQYDPDLLKQLLDERNVWQRLLGKKQKNNDSLIQEAVVKVKKEKSHLRQFLKRSIKNDTVLSHQWNPSHSHDQFQNILKRTSISKALSSVKKSKTTDTYDDDNFFLDHLSGEKNIFLTFFEKNQSLPLDFLQRYCQSEQRDLIKKRLFDEKVDDQLSVVDKVLESLNVDTLQLLMMYGFNPLSYKSHYKENILHLLAYQIQDKNLKSVMNILKTYGLSQSIIREFLLQNTLSGHTPVARAIKEKNQVALSYFIQYLDDQYDWYQKNTQGQTLLHMMSSWQDVNALDKSFFEPLTKAMNLKTETWLRKQLRVVDDDGVSPILEAVGQKNISMIQWLLKHELSLGIRKKFMRPHQHLGGCDHQGNNLFHYASRWNNAQRFKELIHFVKQNDPDVMQTLFNTPNKLGRTPLQTMLYSSEKLESILLLLKNKVSIQYLFHYTATWKEEPLKQLMRYVQQYYPGSLPRCLSEKNEEGQTPSDIAKIHGKPDPLQYYRALAFHPTPRVNVPGASMLVKMSVLNTNQRKQFAQNKFTPAENMQAMIKKHKKE